VTGETLEDCLTVIRELNRRGMKANVAVLGEAVTDAGQASQARAEYERLLMRVSEKELRANAAVKLTLFGLDLSRDLAEGNLSQALQVARGVGNFIRLDMEDSSHVEATLEIYRHMRHSGFDNLGLALQAYLYRTHDDLESLLPLQPNVRIVKGAYLERPDVAWPDKKDVDRNFMRLVERSLRSDAYTAIATHDDALIEASIGYADRHRIPRSRFEFQMLYGIRPGLQRELVNRGYQVLVATTYGPHWYPFFMRRLAERPANLLFFLRNVGRD